VAQVCYQELKNQGLNGRLAKLAQVIPVKQKPGELTINLQQLILPNKSKQ
jgi:hypothetical protein